MKSKKPKDVKAWMINVDVYSTSVVLVYCKFESFMQYMKNCNVETDLEKNCGGAFIKVTDSKTSAVDYVVWISADHKEIREVVVHEAVHCAMTMLSDRGVDYTGDNQEALAYMTGYIVDQSYKKLKLQIKKDEMKQVKKNG